LKKSGEKWRTPIEMSARDQNSHSAQISLQLVKNDYTCIEIAIFAIANRKGIQ
tara:strand:+ start:437 stop:595 length:159 start_codon:yes stop_codon:yes gene_type:complete